MRRLIAMVAPCALIICAFALPSNAAAATVNLSGDTITVSGGANVSYNGLAYVFDATGITAETGCSQVTSNQVSCVSSFPRSVVLNGSGNVAASVPAGGSVSLYGTTSSPNAVVGITVDNVTGNVTTGSGPDIITGGGASYKGTIHSGDGSDSITVYTNLPEISKPLLMGLWNPPPPTGYPASTNAFEGEVDFWPVYIEAGDGDDLIDSSAGDGGVFYKWDYGYDTFLGGKGHDWAYHDGEDTDTYLMGPGDDEVWSYADNEGDDITYGGPGDDRYIQQPNVSEEMFDGGPGMDSTEIHGSTGWEDLGSSYNMTLDGVHDDGPAGEKNWTSTVENFQSDEAGIPIVGVGNAADNVMSGTAYDDTMTGGPGEDTIYADYGDDTIYANDGAADYVEGWAGNDTIYALDGAADTIDCGEEDEGDDDADVVYADAGDTVSENCEIVNP